MLSDPCVRENATNRANPKLASMALKVRIMRIRKVFVCVVGP